MELLKVKTVIENCAQVVLDFLKKELGIEVSLEEILVAHRIGADIGKDRLMVVRCTPGLKSRILANKKKLRSKVNANDQYYYVNAQIPESRVAERREIAHKIKEIKGSNEGKTPDQRTKFKLQGQKLIIGDQPMIKQVKPPAFEELFPDMAEQERMEKIKLWYSDPRQENGSVFTAIGVKVSSVAEVNRAYRRMRQLYPSANHIAVGYECGKAYACQDDSEWGFGLAIQKILEGNSMLNRAVFVVRNAGGTRLGVRRFQILADIVNEVIIKIK